MDEDWDAQRQVEAEEHQPELFGEDYQEEEEDDILDMGEEDNEANEKEGLLMRFCPHDSSMLYPQVCINSLA